MILKFKTRKTSSLPTLFLTKETQSFPIETKVNIVLSPSFYWFKDETLPVKKASAAKALAPSIFDGMLQEGEYSYQAVKKEESFWLFAYDDLLIAQMLSDIGIKPSHIGHIYFAQSECVEIPEPMQVSETSALISNEGVVSLVPLAYIKQSSTVEKYFSAHRFSKEQVNVNFFQNNFVDEKYLYRLMVVFLFIIGIYLSSYIVASNDLAQEKLRAYALSEKYSLPSTSFERKGLKRALETKQKRQIKLRKDIQSLINIPLKKGEYIKKIIIKEKSAHLEIMLSDVKRAKVIQRRIEQSMKVTKAKVVDTLFLVGVKYE